MDACTPEVRDDTGCRPSAEPVLPPNPGYAFVWAAQCAGSAAWGRSLGFEVVALGVAADPLAAIRGLGLDEYGRGGMTLDVIQPDAPAWDEWALVPAFGPIPPSESVQAWGAAVRVRLPAGCDAALLGRRFAALMLPLEAARLGTSATGAEAREAAGRMPPASPRFTRTASGCWAPAHCLYRWQEPEDARYAARALGAAVSSLLFAWHELDLVADAPCA